MKKINNYISEKLHLGSNIKTYKYFPKNKDELTRAIDELINQQDVDEGIDLTSIDTSSITDMSKLFYDMDKLQKVDVSTWDTSKVTTMYDMFGNCNTIEVDVSDWNVSNVTTMENMFESCFRFNCDLSKWNVRNVKNINSMFYLCASFEGKGLKKWKLSKKLKELYSVFWGCLKFNEDISKWDVSNITDMFSLFRNCQTFNADLSKWKLNVRKVLDMSHMFSGCKSFDQDLSGWIVNDYAEHKHMFDNCYIKYNHRPFFAY